MNDYPEIQELLENRADLQARLKLLAYDGTPEIKENASGKYLYIRKRVGSRIRFINYYFATMLKRRSFVNKYVRLKKHLPIKASQRKGYLPMLF